MFATIDSLSASQLLKVREPEGLFCRGVTPNGDVIRDEYRRLARLWHADKNKAPEATATFTHITKLYDEALAKLAADSWQVPGIFEATATNGKRLRVEYRVRRKFELGEMFIGDTSIAQVVRKERADLFANAVAAIKTFRYPSKRVQDDVQRYLPSAQIVMETKDSLILVSPKTPDLLLLSDVIEHFAGNVDPKHAAWIISSLLNLACYFQVSGLTHNAIGPESYFVSPQYHSGALLGGWWYARVIGESLAVVPRRTFVFAPSDVIASKSASARVDLELIRATAREMFGDATGSKLAASKVAPQPMIDWMRLPSGGDAISDYRTWKELVLPASFGARKFVELKLTADDLYLTN